MNSAIGVCTRRYSHNTEPDGRRRSSGSFQRSMLQGKVTMISLSSDLSRSGEYLSVEGHAQTAAGLLVIIHAKERELLADPTSS